MLALNDKKMIAEKDFGKKFKEACEGTSKAIIELIETLEKLKPKKQFKHKSKYHS